MGTLVEAIGGLYSSEVGIGCRISDVRRTTVAAAIVLLTTAAVLTVAVRGYRALLEETFRERSIAYVHAFAGSASGWTDPLNGEMLRAASRFLLVGSAAFVRIERNGTVLVDEREGGAQGIELTPTPPVAAGEMHRVAAAGPYLEVTVPLAFSGQAEGTVRIGLERVSVSARARAMTWTSAGIAGAVDALLLGALAWSHRGRRRRRDGASSDAVPAAEAPLVVGGLRIDRATKQVTLAGRPVQLTPKQYTLLAYLAERSDRVVSEKEIVAAVWPDSPYADAKDVKQYIYLLRKRLADADPDGRSLIVNAPGFGYRLDPVDRGLTDR